MCSRRSILACAKASRPGRIAPGSMATHVQCRLGGRHADAIRPGRTADLSPAPPVQLPPFGSDRHGPDRSPMPPRREATPAAAGGSVSAPDLDGRTPIWRKPRASWCIRRNPVPRVHFGGAGIRRLSTPCMISLQHDVAAWRHLIYFKLRTIVMNTSGFAKTAPPEWLLPFGKKSATGNSARVSIASSRMRRAASASLNGMDANRSAKPCAHSSTAGSPRITKWPNVEMAGRSFAALSQ